jgi:lysophospholipase L1-like esterase
VPIPSRYRLREFFEPLRAGPSTGKVNHVWFEGDSISSPQSPRYEQGVVKKWALTWTGWVTAGSEPFSPSNNGDAGTHATVNKEYDWYSGVSGSFPYGGTTVAPGTQNYTTWSGDDSAASILLRTTYDIGYDGQWSNGSNWLSNVPLAWKWNFWGTANSLSKLRLRGRRTNDDNNDTRDNNIIAANTVVSVTTPIKIYTNAAGTPACDMFTEDTCTETAASAANHELVQLPALCYKHDGTGTVVGTRVSGTYFSCQASHGGFDPDLHIAQNRCSVTARRNFYRDVQGAVSGDTVYFVIQLGTNNATGYTGSQYAQRTLAMIQNRRTICAVLGLSCRFLLISPYDTTSGSQYQQDLSVALYQLALTNADVSFYDLYSQAGPFATLNATYLADGVHPNATGAAYFMQLVWDAGTASLSDPSVNGVGLASRSNTRGRRISRYRR